jgi:hypothetical protein
LPAVAVVLAVGSVELVDKPEGQTVRLELMDKVLVEAVELP